MPRITLYHYFEDGDDSLEDTSDDAPANMAPAAVAKANLARAITQPSKITEVDDEDADAD